jgi:hypothetical protein
LDALTRVGEILEPMGSAKLFPSFGFGGIPTFLGMRSVNHCFALNGDPLQPEILGMKTVLKTYKDTVNNITQAGPTLFQPLLEQLLSLIKSKEDEKVYHVMIVFTDGTIHDLPRTKDVLVQLSE